MINLQLLSKVSGYDSDFRRRVLQMIAGRFERVNKETMAFLADRRYSAVYLHMKQYLHDLQPYSKLTEMNALKDDLQKLRLATTNEEREMRAKMLLNAIHNGLVQTNIHLDIEDESTSQVKNAAPEGGE